MCLLVIDLLTMSVQVKVSEPLYDRATEVAEAYDITIKEAINRMARDGGYDV